MLMADCKVPATLVIFHSNTSRRSIFDARLNFEIEKGDVIAFEFVIPKVIEQAIEPWPRINLPDIPELRQKVADIGSSKIRTNFAFGVPKTRKRKSYLMTVMKSKKMVSKLLKFNSSTKIRRKK